MLESASANMSGKPISPKDTDIVVLIPHYNNLEGLKNSLSSISQSTIPVDVLVVDDGSSISIEEEKLQKIYPSTTVLHSPKNEGIEQALNRGLTHICDNRPYKYVARLDAEDICSPDRFAKEREFLENNPDVFLVGSWALFVDSSDKPLWRFCPPAKHEQICRRMFLNNMFCHPTVMCRLEMFKEVGFYSTKHPSAEDFALFFRVTRRFKVANIPEYLVKTFVTPGGISLSWRNQQLKSRFRIILDNFDFSFWAFYGLIRNLLLWPLPVSFIRYLKFLLFRPSVCKDFSPVKTKMPSPSLDAKIQRKEKLKIAFICDWLVAMRGGERCLEAICEIYPDADVFTLVHLPGSVSKTIESSKIQTSYIQRLPGGIKNFRQYLPLFPHAIRRFDLSGYDFILSFSHCVAKNVKVPKGIPHICYCHTPMRYAWHMRSEYLSKFNGLKKWSANILLDRLKNGDRKSASEVTHFIANSKNVQNRIKQAYDRDSIVIYPPVDCDRFTVSCDDDGYYLVVSALVPYKRIDIAIEAFSEADRKLVVVGNGPELPFLKSMASDNVSFIEDADDNQVVEYIKRCTALIFPGEEDFGIVPLEAQACGKQVIAFGRGGALETVIGLNHTSAEKADATGVFFFEQMPEELNKSISLFEQRRKEFDARKCRDNALRFDRSIYQKSMQNYIRSVLG